MTLTLERPEAEATAPDPDEPLGPPAPRTHWGNGLPVLNPAIDLGAQMDRLVRDVCDIEVPEWAFTDPPERPAVLDQFKPLRIIKKGQTGKVKSTRGFVWVDHDPSAVLLNKYVNRSCHTLDNTEYSYRGGNVNYAYCPYMASVFAGALSPLTTAPVIAESPCTDDTITLDTRDGGDREMRLRPHQASANVWLVRDEKGRPFLLLTRLYDSCQENNPWAHSLVRYFEARCRRLGLGLALGDTWGGWRVTSDKTDDVEAHFGKSRCDSRALVWTPAFDLPFRAKGRYNRALGPVALDGYGVSGTGDDSLGWHLDANGFRFGGEAYLVLDPAPGVEQAGPLFPEVGEAPWDGYHTRPEGFSGSDRVTCYACDERVDRGEARSHGGDWYCTDCYHDRFYTCDSCGDAVPDGETWSADGDDNTYCESCYTGRYRDCDACDTATRRDDLHSVYPVSSSGDVGGTDQVCESCRSGGDVNTCDACGEDFDVSDAPADWGGPDPWETEDGEQGDEDEWLCGPCRESRRRERETEAAYAALLATGVRPTEREALAAFYGYGVDNWRLDRCTVADSGYEDVLRPAITDGLFLRGRYFGSPDSLNRQLAEVVTARAAREALEPALPFDAPTVYADGSVVEWDFALPDGPNVTQVLSRSVSYARIAASVPLTEMVAPTPPIPSPEELDRAEAECGEERYDTARDAALRTGHYDCGIQYRECNVCRLVREALARIIAERRPTETEALAAWYNHDPAYVADAGYSAIRATASCGADRVLNAVRTGRFDFVGTSLHGETSDRLNERLAQILRDRHAPAPTSGIDW